MPPVSQLSREAHHGGRAPLKRLGADDLRAEMHVNADRLQPGLRRHLAIQGARLLERNAELVDVQARRDVWVRAGVDVGIDAHRHPRAHTSRLRRAIDALQLARGLGVDGLQAELHRPLDFVGRLADAAEHDVGRSEIPRASPARLRRSSWRRRRCRPRAAGARSPATSSPSGRSECGADATRRPRRARGTPSESPRRCRRRAACRARARSLERDTVADERISFAKETRHGENLTSRPRSS